MKCRIERIATITFYKSSRASCTIMEVEQDKKEERRERAAEEGRMNQDYQNNCIITRDLFFKWFKTEILLQNKEIF